MSDRELANVLAWALVALGLWLLLILPFRRLRVPEPVAIAATMSWLLARLVLLLFPAIRHWMRIALAPI